MTATLASSGAGGRVIRELFGKREAREWLLGVASRPEIGQDDAERALVLRLNRLLAADAAGGLSGHASEPERKRDELS